MSKLKKELKSLYTFAFFNTPGRFWFYINVDFRSVFIKYFLCNLKKCNFSKYKLLIKRNNR